MMNISSIGFTSFLAINTDKYVDIYKQYEEYFSQFSIMNDILRQIGWFALKGLLKLTGMMNTLSDKAFEFINFLDSDEIIRFFNVVKPFIWTVFLFALIYLAYCYIYAHEKPKGIIANILIFAGTVMILPYMMTQMNQLVSYGKEVLSTDMEENSYTLLVPYITDLVYLDGIDFDKKKFENGDRNGFSEKNCDNIRYMDINELVDPGDYELVNEKLFKQHIFLQIKDGVPKIEVIGIKKNKIYFPGTVPYYYRYHVNYFIAALYLAALILVMAFTSFKMVQLVFELAAEKIMAPFIAAGDLTGGQKIRKALVGILNGYITILCILFLQRLFILATQLINMKTWSDNTAGNGFIKAVLILGGALFIIDGPNFFEQIFGIDAGLKSVGQAIQSTYYASQMAGGIVRGAKGIAGKAGNALKGATGKVAGAGGFFGGMKDTGAFDSNNEKVSQDMAMDFGPPDFDSNHALGAGSEEMGGYSELPGGGQPGLPGGGTDAAASGKEAEGSLGKSAGTGESDIPEGTGKQNLTGSQTGKGAEQNEDINHAINDALNNADIGQGSASEGSLGDVPDNDNLSNWAMRNTRAGRYLKGSYDKGRSLGRAVGNTINNRNRKKENSAPDKPEPTDQMNRDNLKE